MPVKRTYARLSRLEITIYVILWLFTIFCAVFKVFGASERLVIENIAGHTFQPGWAILNRKKDISDYEWTAWIYHLKIAIPWLFLNLCYAELTRFYYTKGLPVTYATITCLFMLLYYPLGVLGIFICLFLIFYSTMLCNSRILLWIISLSSIIVIKITNSLFMDFGAFTAETYIISQISSCWFILRCIEFADLGINNQQRKLKKLFDMIAYTCYFPCFHFGPFIPYEEFSQSVYLEFESWKYGRLFSFARKIGKYIMWTLIFEIALHYFYCNAMFLQTDIFSYDLWTLNGIGYCTSQFFFIKYFVIYGLMGSFAQVERYYAPPSPRCLHTIHMYSDMWRYFDRGFYFFIFRRIYKPICGNTKPSVLKKLWASLLCFSFVFLWHGLNLTVFYWSVFNFIGITLEAIGKCVGDISTVKNIELIHLYEEQEFLWNVKHKLYRNHNKKISTYEEFATKFKNCDGNEVQRKIHSLRNQASLSERTVRRIHSLLAAPLWVLAVISNFMFFSGDHFDFLYFKQFYYGSWKVAVMICAVSYCMCQISIELNLWTDYKEKELMYNRRKSKGK